MRTDVWSVSGIELIFGQFLENKLIFGQFLNVTQNKKLINPRRSVGRQEDDARARVLAMSFLGDPFELRGRPYTTWKRISRAF